MQQFTDTSPRIASIRNAEIPRARFGTRVHPEACRNSPAECHVSAGRYGHSRAMCDVVRMMRKRMSGDNRAPPPWPAHPCCRRLATATSGRHVGVE